MANVGSGVPLVPRKGADDLVDRIAALKVDADARGFGAVAYFLNIALSEAEIQARRIENGEQDAGPYRPVPELE